MLVLPDDILYLVLSHLDTAKDILSLLLTNRRLKNVIQADHKEGWRIFVRSRFPDMRDLPTSAYGWDQLADSLTWQTRAWDRRSVYFQAMLPMHPRDSGNRGERMQHRPHQKTAFHPVVAAHCDLAAREDLVVWGAGEVIVARRRQGRKADWTPRDIKCHGYGDKMGLQAGHDDVTALTIVKNVYGTVGELGMLVGRDNGSVAFLGAGEGNFGQQLAGLGPRHAVGDGAGWTQENINDIDVLHRQGLVAVAAKSALLLYNLPKDTSTVNIAPSAFLSFETQRPGESWESVGGAKWMGEDTLALGLSGFQDALRYVKVIPTGLEYVMSVKNATREEKFCIDPTKSRLCTRSLTPIDASSIMGGRGSNLLLTAWRDGTVHLQDLRTPAPPDLVYCDNIDPWSTFEALLPFGTSHFVAGASHSATIKIFDFRWPRQYYLTTAFPCGVGGPIPNPPQPFILPPKSTLCSRCAPLAGRRCNWHALSQSLYHRPNATFFFSKSLPRADARASVWSLARGAPLAPSFYVGISNGVVEAALAAPLPPLPPRRSRHHERSVRLPPMRGQGGWARGGRAAGTGAAPAGAGAGTAAPAGLVARHRLDARYHAPADFRPGGAGE